MNKFEGFPEYPDANFTIVPNVFLDNPGGFSSIIRASELKVVVYIIRQTWGFQMYDKPRKLTLNEICNGRRRKDGTKLDNGCGMSRSSAQEGINSALKHGFIEVTEDKSDLAKVKKFYKLKTINSGKSSPTINNTDCDVESTEDTTTIAVDDDSQAPKSDCRNIAPSLPNSSGQNPVSGYLNPVSGYLNPVSGYLNPVSGYLNPVSDLRNKPSGNKLSGNKPCEKEDRARKVSSPKLKEEFIHWYGIYPRKVSRRKAYESFLKAVDRIVSDKGIPESEAITILEQGAVRYSQEVAGENPKYTKHPTTWLNQDCWEDEPMKPQEQSSPKAWWDRSYEKIHYRDREDYNEKILQARLRIADRWPKVRDTIPEGTVINKADYLNAIAIDMGYPGYEYKYWPCHADYCGHACTKKELSCVG